MSLARNKRAKQLKNDKMSKFDDVFGTKATEDKTPLKPESKIKKVIKKTVWTSVILYVVFSIFYTAISLISKLF